MYRKTLFHGMILGGIVLVAFLIMIPYSTVDKTRDIPSNPDLVHFDVLSAYKEKVGSDAYFNITSLWHSMYSWEPCLRGINDITVDEENGVITVFYPNEFRWEMSSEYDYLWKGDERLEIRDWCDARGIHFQGQLTAQ